MNIRRALVTGSTGFIGSRLVSTLVKQGWEVKAGKRASSNLGRLNQVQCAFVPLDLAGGDTTQVDQATEDVDIVFHVAGLVCGTPENLDRVNRQGTELLCQRLARRTSPPKLIVISSAAAAGPSIPGCPKTPDMPPCPISNYGRSKLAGERAALSFAASVPTAVVRPGVVFGEGDTEFIRILRAMPRLRMNPMVGRGDQPISMIEAGDLVDLIIRTALQGDCVERVTPQGDAEAGGGIYHAADPQALSLVELGKIVREILNRPGILDLHLPKSIGYLVGASAEFTARLFGKMSTLNRDKIAEATASGWEMDVEKSLKHLQWSPSQSLAEHIGDTLHRGITEKQL